MDLRKRWHQWFHNGDLDAARVRVEIDAERVSKTADRIDQGTGSLENKVKVNHISATVTALLRGGR